MELSGELVEKPGGERFSVVVGPSSSWQAAQVPPDIIDRQLEAPTRESGFPV